MGVDLSIVPERYRSSERRAVLGYDRLEIQGRYYDFWESLLEAAVVLDEGMYTYNDEGCVKVFCDPYGTKLTWIKAGTFIRLWAIQNTRCDLGVWDKAVFKFVEALPDDTRLILWFH